jgi:hypothetical protein
MIDLTKIDDSTLMARGGYSTVNSALKDERKNLQMLTGELSSATSRILRQMQPEADAVPQPADALLAAARATLDAVELCAGRIVALAQQKHDLRAQAWGRK